MLAGLYGKINDGKIILPGYSKIMDSKIMLPEVLAKICFRKHDSVVS